MALSFARRTKDALTIPSTYFERVRLEHQMKDSLAYLLVTSLITYGALLLPLIGFLMVADVSPLYALLGIILVPLSIICSFIVSGLSHLAVMAVNGKYKRFLDSFKLIVFSMEPMRLVGLVILYIFGIILLLVAGTSWIEALALAEANPLLMVGLLAGLLTKLFIVYLAFTIVQSIHSAYTSFLFVVGMHKLHNLSLERAFWTSVLAAVFNAVFFALMYAGLYLLTLL